MNPDRQSFHGSRPRHLLPPLLALLLLFPGLAQALSSDREQPIYIQADRVAIDEKTGISTYQGSVEVSQGSLRFSAEQLTVHRSDKGLERIVADGEPARFRQRPDKAELDVRGQARHLEYLADRAVVELTGEAHLWQGQDEFSGERIIYDKAQDRVEANGSKQGKGRVHAVIHPSKGVAEGAEAAP